MMMVMMLSEDPLAMLLTVPGLVILKPVEYVLALYPPVKREMSRDALYLRCVRTPQTISVHIFQHHQMLRRRAPPRRRTLRHFGYYSSREISREREDEDDDETKRIGRNGALKGRLISRESFRPIYQNIVSQISIFNVCERKLMPRKPAVLSP